MARTTAELPMVCFACSFLMQGTHSLIEVIQAYARTRIYMYICSLAEMVVGTFLLVSLHVSTHVGVAPRR